jgi:hypothetical protein
MSNVSLKQIPRQRKAVFTSSAAEFSELVKAFLAVD